MKKLLIGLSLFIVASISFADSGDTYWIQKKAKATYSSENVFVDCHAKFNFQKVEKEVGGVQYDAVYTGEGSFVGVDCYLYEPDAYVDYIFEGLELIREVQGTLIGQYTFDEELTLINHEKFTVSNQLASIAIGVDAVFNNMKDITSGITKVASTITAIQEGMAVGGVLDGVLWGIGTYGIEYFANNPIGLTIVISMAVITNILEHNAISEAIDDYMSGEAQDLASDMSLMTSEIIERQVLVNKIIVPVNYLILN